MEQEKCICQQEESEKELAYGEYTLLKIEKDKFGLYIVAIGKGEAYWKPVYCPICGRKLH